MPLSSEHSDVRGFFDYLGLKNLSHRTIIEYRWVLKDLFRFVPPELATPQDVAFEHLRNYVANMQARKLAAKTVSDRVIIIKRFFGYLLAEGRVESDPAQRLPVPKVGKRLPRALTLDEMRALLSAIQTDSSKGRRDRVLFELMYAGGLRVSEAVRLRVEDVDFADGSVRVIGKGDKERRVYLKPSLRQLLREHVDSNLSSGFVFPGRSENALSPRSVQQRIKQYAKTARITRAVSPHTLRHSVAVHYLQGGAPVNFVQGLLGHASLATTGKYLLLTDQMAKDIALRTETALDRLTQTHEYKPGYKLESGFAFDEYVALVMEWLSSV